MHAATLLDDLSIYACALKKTPLSSLTCALVMLSFAVLVFAETEVPPHESPLAAPAVAPLIYRPHEVQFSPPHPSSSAQRYGSSATLDRSLPSLPLLSKLYSRPPSPWHSDSFADKTPARDQPPSSPPVSGCCKPGMVRRHDSRVCHCAYPIRIELLLLNTSFSSLMNGSQDSDQGPFLEELASKLGLGASQIEMADFFDVGQSHLKITVDMFPLKGIGFSAKDAHKVISSLAMHKFHLNPKLVGGYRLVSFTWFKPPAPLPAPGMGELPGNAPPHLPQAPASDNTGKQASLTITIAICFGTLAVIFLSVLIICECQSVQGHEKEPTAGTTNQETEDAVSASESLPHPIITSTWLLPYEELKEATRDFEPASMVGQGGFGKVFKGVLGDGTPVAVKKLTSGRHQGDKQFLVEVEMLSRLHHRNLVKLLGYCNGQDSSQKLLCYELVPNGSLEAWLHGPLGKSRPLGWDTRMKIALDAARGLAYLHEDSMPCVIHRDFKASNILLDNDFHAKVSDFGLAKQAPEGRGKYLSTRIMGTFGYLAPEYAMTGHLLVKSDVYSYGVVLLELLTGRKPVDMSQPCGNENLVAWARPILRRKNRLEELADSKLAGKYPKEDFIRVCTIAAACVSPEASQRPTMGEVVQSLRMVQGGYMATIVRLSSSKYESDGASSSNAFGDVSQREVFSEDVDEGR